MNKERKYVRVVSWRIVWAAMAIVVVAAPYAKCLTVPAGETWDIDYWVGPLYVFGTANLLPGFRCIKPCFVYEGGTVNFIGGDNLIMWAPDGSTVNVIGPAVYYVAVNVYPGTNITIYGTNFLVAGVLYDTPADVPITDAKTHISCTLEDGSVNNIWLQGHPSAVVHLRAPSQQVEIDIKPGSSPNSINLKSKGLVPVAILTTGDFDAQTVDASSVKFAGATPVRSTLEDVDGDGDQDMVLHFKTQELDLDEGSTEADLTGNTLDEKPIEGTDSVNIVPQKKKK